MSPRAGSDLWETGAGAEGCAAFDARLAADVAADGLLSRVRERGLPVDAATSGLRGLRRIEALEDPPADEGARARLALDALRGLEGFVEVAPGAAFLFRARVRLLALPPPLGPALARLDMLRFERYWLEASQDTRAAYPCGEMASAVLQMASLAARTPDARPLEDRLFALAVHLAHESAVGYEVVGRDHGLARQSLSASLSGFRSLLELDPRFRDLVRDAGRSSAFEPTAEDRARTRLASWDYRPPRSPAPRPPRPRDGGRILSLRVGPGKAPFTIAVECETENTGETTWDDGYALRMGLRRAGEAKDIHRPELPVVGQFLQEAERVAPGGRHVFRFAIPVPGNSVWTFRFQLEQREIRDLGDVVARDLDLDRTR